MSFPTTLWGNTYDIYTAVPGPTASSPNSSDGPVLGNYALLADGSAIQFVQFVTSTSTAANAAMIASTTFTNYKVTSSTAVIQLVIAVNDLSGGTPANPNSATSGAVVTVNYCAWVKRKGLAFALCAATTAADVEVAPSATLGVLETKVAATHFQGNMANLTIVGGSTAVSPVFMA